MTAIARRDQDEDYMIAKGWSDDAFGRRNPALDRLYAAIRTRFFPSARTVIEVGFGGGGLLDFLKSQGCAVIGYEISEPLVELARAHGHHAFASDAFIEGGDAPGSVDAIIALDVFEHMDDATVLRTLAAAANRLAPGGRIVIRTPNAASPLGLHYQYSDWTHVNAWSQPYATHCARRSGLRLVSTVGEFDFAPASGPVGLAFSARNAVFKLAEHFLAKSVYRAGGFRLSPNLYFVFERDRGHDA